MVARGVWGRATSSVLITLTKPVGLQHLVCHPERREESLAIGTETLCGVYHERSERLSMTGFPIDWLERLVHV